jgi:hypothetical protein
MKSPRNNINSASEDMLLLFDDGASLDAARVIAE